MAPALGDRPEVSLPPSLMYLATGIGMVGAAGMSPVLPVMQAELGLTDSQIGLVMTLFTLPVIGSVFVFGWLADHVGRKPVLGWSLLLFGVSGTLVFFVDSFRLVLALRVLQGVGFSGFIPIAVTVLGDMFEGADETGAQGLRVTFANAGSFAFPAVAGVLAGVAWNVPFLLFSLALPLGVAVLLWGPEPAATQDKPDRYLRAVLATIRVPVVAVAVGIGFTRFFVIYGIYAYLPVLIVSKGLTVGQAGVVVGAINAAKMLVASQSRLSLSLGKPRLTAGVSLLLSAITAGLFVSGTGFLTFGVLAVLFGGLDGVTAPLQKSVLTKFTEGNVRAAVISFNAAVQNVGKTGGPIAMGALIALDSTSVAFAGLGATASGIAILLIAALVVTDVPVPVARRAAE